MKFTANLATFAAAVEYVANIAPTAGVVPVLSNIRLSAHIEGVTLTTFDYDVSARITTSAGVVDGGECLVPAAVVAHIVKVKGDRIEFVLDDRQAIITCGKATFTVPAMGVDDYPTLPALDEPTCQIDAGALAAAVDRVGYAVSKQDALPFLTGVLFDLTGDQPTLAATDRYRLAASELEVTQYYDTTPFTAIVPLRVLRNFLSGAAGPVEVSFSNADATGQPTMIGLSCAGRTSTGRLLVGAFPNWRGIIPTGQAPLTVALDTGDLREAVGNAGQVLNDKPGAPAMLWLAINPGEICVTGGDETRFSQSVAATVDGESMMVKLRMPFLADVVKSIGTDVMELHLAAPNKPVLARSVGEHAWHVIMPVR